MLKRQGSTRLVAIALLLSTAAACTAEPTSQPAEAGPKTGVDASTTPEASTPAPDPARAAGEQAIETYLGMWREMASAGETSDWQSPALSSFATGDALSVITRSLYTDNLGGVVTRGRPLNAPRVSSTDPVESPSVVMVADCGDSTNSLKYLKGTDRLLNDSPGGRRTITAEVKKQPDGSWRVTRFAVGGLGSC
ncbi:hypothetical protein [Umezawaea sp. NPDC059074]|uniref:hypothetical protein n=1 Tax=Umezawaea sp. NPDC059074 TaxID=3346716 RepID=UPI0036B522E0